MPFWAQRINPLRYWLITVVHVRH
ncbi:conserved protein of unknown function [Limnospira indica PCC 8005]|uniref:Uncharacterized protein n=1 Tax=Limnospira indica PCC 8005 TaxID=376219 RepID=A0A9P1KLC1_9CYAN|nr:conserved protein of unknown function [Limnospira indica PCC 8005]